MTDRQRNSFILLLVAGLLLISGLLIASSVLGKHKTRLGLDLKGGVQLVYQGQPTPQTPKVTQDALARAVDIMRERVDQLGVSEPQIETTGGDLITASLPDVKDTGRAEKLVGSTARLEFYDWEANALAPNGRLVKDLLQARDNAAIQISQGTGAVPPGDPGAGGMPLYDAVKLASSQPAQASPDNSRSGPEYYMFGAPGSAACAAAARAQGKPVLVGSRCLLSGPDDNLSDLYSGLPTGVTKSDGQVLTVPQGTVVLQAADPSAAHPTSFNDPKAQFYVLRDHVSLFGNEITNPQQSTDTAGQPDVAFGFTGKGGKAF